MDARSLRRHLLSSAALVGALSAYGRRVYAACVPSGGSSYQCSGANATTQTINADDANVSTLPGFSVTTVVGNGITITGDGALSYTDTNTSPLSAAAIALSIESTGNVLAGNQGSVTVNANGHLTGNTTGIYARNSGSGSLTITTSGNVAGTTGNGIDAVNFSGSANLTVTTAASTSVSGNYNGIVASNNGVGATSITANGDVSGAIFDGIFARNKGTDLTVTTGMGSNVSGARYGIFARNDGTNLTVTTGRGSTVSGRSGIYALNYYGTGALTINVNGDVTGLLGDGIVALNKYGTDLRITTGAGSNVTGSGTGIYARNYGSGELRIATNGDVTGSLFGIRAFNFGGGALSITANGNVTGTLATGIAALNITGSSLTVTTGAGATVFGGDTGIAAINYGGDLTITVNGDVRGASHFGVNAINYSSAANLSVVTGAGTTVTGGIDGIFVRNDGTGGLTVTANGDVTGTANAGIYANSGAGGPIGITIGPGATIIGGTYGVQIVGDGSNSLKNYGKIESLSGISGTAILADAGDETVDNYGTITGDVDLGDGANAFRNRVSGVFNSGATVNLGAGNVLTNDGVLSPGGNATVLTTTLTGDFAQTGAGRFAVNLQGASSDLLDVTGRADLDGHVQPLFTLSGLGSATQWTILTAATGSPPVVNDGIVVDNTAAVKFGLLFTPTEMDLVLLSVNFAAQGLNRNETSIGENLNAIYGAGGGSLVSLLDALAGLPTLGGLANALDQLSPEVYLDTEIAAFFSQLAFTNAMMSCPTREGANAFIKEGQCVWARVSGRDLNQDSAFQTLGFDETSFEVAGGAQFALDSVWRLGFALGYEHANLETDTNAKSDGDRFDGGVVVKYNPGPLLLAAGISGGFGTYDFDRPINFPGFSALAKSGNDIGTIDARLRAAYLVTSGAWYAKPLVDFDATWLTLGSTLEQGAAGASLNVRGNNETVLSVSPALEIGTQIKWTDGTLLRPYLRGGATFFGNNDFALLASFEGAPAGVGPFRIATRTDDVVADVGAGLDWIGRGGTELKLFYEGRIGDLVSEQSGGLKASMPF